MGSGGVDIDWACLKYVLKVTENNSQHGGGTISRAAIISKDAADVCRCLQKTTAAGRDHGSRLDSRVERVESSS